jgi:hypothetical protein
MLSCGLFDQEGRRSTPSLSYDKQHTRGKVDSGETLVIGEVPNPEDKPPEEDGPNPASPPTKTARPLKRKLTQKILFQESLEPIPGIGV